MKITIFGSCRQDSLYSKFSVSNIKNHLTYPHYTKEIIQAIKFCKGVSNIPPELTRWIFRSGLLDKRILHSEDFHREYNESDTIVVEIASRISYLYKGFWAHHELENPQYECGDRNTIIRHDLTDEEIEEDILEIRNLVYPKKLFVCTHITTRKSGKRYELVQLIKKICNRYNISCFDPAEVLQTCNPDEVFVKEDVLAHYTQKGHSIIGQAYEKWISPRKTVIHTWIQNTLNLPQEKNANFWGLGDMLRGSCAVFEVCKRLNYDFYIDTSQHPLHSFFQTFPNHNYSDLIQREKNNIRFECFSSHNDIEQFLKKNFETSNVVFFHTNGPGYTFHGNLSNECKEYFKSILKPSEKLYKNIQTQQLNIELPYTICHFRLGDKGCVEKIMDSNEYYQSIINKATTLQTKNTICLTDNEFFKEFVKKTNVFQTLSTKICHLGTSSNEEEIADTLIEFFFCCNAQKIYSYSIYEWVSGFVNIAHRIFDVPLYQIEK